ncbi:hypothetical protein D9M72_563550 [compost metagenome]
MQMHVRSAEDAAGEVREAIASQVDHLRVDLYSVHEIGSGAQRQQHLLAATSTEDQHSRPCKHAVRERRRCPVEIGDRRQIAAIGGHRCNTIAIAEDGELRGRLLGVGEAEARRVPEWDARALHDCQ